MKACLVSVLVPLLCMRPVRLTRIVPYREKTCECPHSCAEAEMLGLVLEDKPVWIELGEYKRIVLASCRMSDGGGWTVIQRRIDNRVTFMRSWTEYCDGFGGRWPKDSMWFGNENTWELLKSQGPSVLQVKLEAFDGGRATADYGSFRLDNASQMYRMYVDSPARIDLLHESLLISNGSRFSHFENVVDKFMCAGSMSALSSGWWWPEFFDDPPCRGANLNGLFNLTLGDNGFYNNFWYGFRKLRGLRYSEMRVRPINFSSFFIPTDVEECALTKSFKCRCKFDDDYEQVCLMREQHRAFSTTVVSIVFTAIFALFVYIIWELRKVALAEGPRDWVERMVLMGKQMEAMRASLETSQRNDDVDDTPSEETKPLVKEKRPTKHKRNRRNSVKNKSKSRKKSKRRKSLPPS